MQLEFKHPTPPSVPTSHRPKSWAISERVLLANMGIFNELCEIRKVWEVDP